MINSIASSCKSCLFAKWDGNTQTGCEFGRIEKVQYSNAYELVEAYDNDKEFYVINNHICPYQRTDKWISANDEDRIEKVKREVYMRWGAIILVDQNNTSFDTVNTRIKELKSQSISPKYAVLILKNADGQLSDNLFNLMNKNFDIWHVQIQLDNDKDDRFYIDMAFDKLKTSTRIMFYTVFDINQPISLSLYDKVFKYVIEDMNQYGIIKHKDSIHEMVVNKITHLKYNGNAHNQILEDKVKKDNGPDTYFIKYYEDI